MSDPSPDHADNPFPDPSSIQTKSEFFAALNRLHDQSGLTFREVSRDIQLSHQAVNGYVRGKHLPQSRGRNGELFLELLRVGYRIDDQRQLDAWTAALRRVSTTPGPRPADETVPYPGLRPFQPDEGDWFFGRDELVDQLRTALADGIEHGPRTMLLTGASGSGKSSLINVGIIAAAADDEHLAGWRVEPMTPGTDPVKTLTEALETDPGTPCLLVIDQMEELWADQIDTEHRQRFLTLLQAAIDESEPHRFIVMSMRADFYAELLGDRFLRDLADACQIPVGPMSTEQLAAAIERPARAVNAEVEPELTELLLRDLATDDVSTAGALPLLALALQDLWRQGRRQSMSAADYRASGGLADIVKRTAEDIWDALAPDGQPTARELLTRMVSVHEDLPLTRRHLTPEQLDAYRRHDPDADRIARALVDARLVVLDHEGLTLAHDVLLRAWPRLQEWIDADRQRLAAHGELTRSVSRWEQHDRDHTYLYPQRRLDIIQQQLGPAPPPLSVPERNFLTASGHRATRARRLRRNLVAALAVLLVASLVSLFIAVEQHAQAEEQTATAESERRDAESRLIATNAAQLRESDPALAAQLAVASYQASPTLEARSALLSATATPSVTRMFGTQGAVIERIAVSPGGELLAAAAASGDLWVWDISDPFHPELLHSGLPEVEGTIRTVRFADDTSLYSAGESGTIYLHDLTDRSHPQLTATATGPTGGVNFIEFHAASGTVAAGGIDGHVWLWPDPDLQGEPLQLAGPGGSVKSIAFTTDGARLAAASFDGTAAIYDLGDAVPAPVILDEGFERLATIAFSPDGALMAAGTTTGSVALWDTSGEPELLTVLEGPGAWAFSVVFLPGTPYLAIGAGDGLWLWNYESGALPDRIPSSGPVPDVALDPRDGTVYASYTDGSVRRWQLPGSMLTSADGSVLNLAFVDGGPLALASNAGSVWLWDTEAPMSGPVRELTNPDPQERLLSGVAASPDGTRLAALGSEGNIWLWNTADWDVGPVALTGLTGALNQLVFSSGGDRLAAVADNGWLAIWDLESGSDPVLLEQVTTGGGEYAIAYSPGDELLVTSGADRTIRLWDGRRTDELVQTGVLEGPAQVVQHLVFNADGSLLAAASDDGNAYLWSTEGIPEDSPDPTVLSGNGGRLQTVAFGPGRTFLAGASRAGSIILWSLDEPERPERFAELTGSGAGLITVGFNGDGSLVAGAGHDPTARLWLTDLEAAIAAICDAAGTILTAEEWDLHVPGVDYRPPC